MSSGEAAYAGGSSEYELQALNFHSSICNTGPVINTFTVPDNIYIVSIGTLGGWTADSLSENLGNKIVTGQDFTQDGKPNIDLSSWLKINYSKLIPNPKFGELLLYYPKILCPDRNLNPDKDAMIPETQEYLTMRYFTEKDPIGQPYGVADFLTRRREGAPQPRKAALKVAEKAKGSHLFLSDFVEKISRQNPSKKIILFILGCQVISDEVQPKQVILRDNYLKAKKAGLILVEMLPRVFTKEYINIQSAGPVHDDTYKEGALADAGWLGIDVVTDATRGMWDKIRGPLSADFNITEIKKIAEKIIEISGKQETSSAKRIKSKSSVGGKRKRRKTKRKSRQLTGYRKKKKQTRQKRTKKNRKNKIKR